MYLLIDCFLLSLFAHYHRRRIRQKRRQRSSLLVGGRNCFKFNNALELLHQDDLKKRMNKRKDTWRNGCFGKMDAHPVHTIPNHQAPKMNVLPKTFLQIILAAKWLVGHSMSLKQQRRSSLLSDSSYMHTAHQPLYSQIISKLLERELVFLL